MNGNACVFMLFMIPTFLVITAAVTYIMQVAFAKARLTVALGRASKAAAASVAASMDEIASANADIYDAYQSLRRDFGDDTQKNEKAAQNRYKMYEEARDAGVRKVDSILSSLVERARSKGEATFHSNVADASVDISIEPDIAISPTSEPGLQWQVLGSDYIIGQSIADPRSTGNVRYDAFKYFIKERAPGPRIEAMGYKNVPPIVGNFAPVTVRASSAAVVFGGSVAGYALLRGQGARGGTQSSDHLYRSILVSP
jgi:hypothetical protein